MSPSKKLITLTAAALGFVLLVLSCYTWTSPDIWYHLFLGRRILETGMAQPSDSLLLQQDYEHNIYWLFQLLCYGAYRFGGIWAINAWFGGLWFAIGAVWLRLTRALEFPLIGLPLALCALLVCQVRFEQRPEILSYLFLLLEISWLTRWDFDRLSRGQLAKFVLVQVLWTNMHGYFALGPAVVGLKLATELATANRRTRKNLFVLLGVTVLSTIVSPFGVKTWFIVAFQWHFLSAMRYAVQEFLPPLGMFLHLWTVWIFWCLWAAVLVSGIWLVRQKPGQWFAVALVVPGLYLSATSLRNVPLFFLFSAPLFAVLNEDFQARWTKWVTVSTWSVLACCVWLIPWVVSGRYYFSLGSESTFGVRLSDAAYPVHFADYLRETGFRGKIFNDSWDGGYLEYHFPTLPLYADSRFVDVDKIQEYFGAQTGGAAFERLSEKNHFDGVLIRIVDSPQFVASLMQDARWQLAYADLHRVFFLNTEKGPWDRKLFRPGEVYQGQDLSQRVHGRPAIQWVQLLVQLGRTEVLLDVLDQFSRAPTIPSFVVEFALQYGIRIHSPALIEKAMALRPKLLALQAADERAVDELIASVRR